MHRNSAFLQEVIAAIAEAAALEAALVRLTDSLSSNIRTGAVALRELSLIRHSLSIIRNILALLQEPDTSHEMIRTVTTRAAQLAVDIEECCESLDDLSGHDALCHEALGHAVALMRKITETVRLCPSID